jgi:heme A synthase
VGLHRFVVFTTVCTFFLLIAGALVTSSDAGLSVPSWPFAPGTLLPRMAGGAPFEYSHRMVAGFVGLLTMGVAIWAWRRERRRWVHWLVMAALGAITVLYFLPLPVSVAHAALAQFFFCTLVSLALFTGSWWQSELPPLEEKGQPALRTVASATVGIIFLQLILGAAFRHNAFGALPHIFGARVVTLAASVWLMLAAFRVFGPVAEFAMVPALRPDPRRREQTVSVRPS